MKLFFIDFFFYSVSDDEDGENDENAGVHKLKYERVARELEFTKRRLQTQHSHDLEQLVGLKKQLEKKVSFFFILIFNWIEINQIFFCLVSGCL